MQDRFPAGTNVLQLPYMSYPEHGSVVGVGDYDLFKGYLHSKGLRWTYGAVEGRPTDWLAQHQGLAPEQLAAAAAAAGFGAVYVDRAGYADGGAAVTGALGALAGPQNSGLSADKRLQFFDLRPAAARLTRQTTPAERSQIRDALLYPVVVGFGAGVSYQEMAGPTPYRWAAADARLTLENPLEGSRTVHVAADLFGGGPGRSTVKLTLPDGSSRSVTVDPAGRAHHRAAAPEAGPVEAASADHGSRGPASRRQRARPAPARRRECTSSTRRWPHRASSATSPPRRPERRGRRPRASARPTAAGAAAARRRRR